MCALPYVYNIYIYYADTVLCGCAMWSGLYYYVRVFVFLFFFFLSTPDHRTAVKINLNPPSLPASIFRRGPFTRLVCVCIFSRRKSARYFKSFKRKPGHLAVEL